MTVKQARQAIKEGKPINLLRGLYGTFNRERIKVLNVRIRRGHEEALLPAFTDQATRKHYRTAWFTLRPEMDDQLVFERSLNG